MAWFIRCIKTIVFIAKIRTLQTLSYQCFRTFANVTKGDSVTFIMRFCVYFIHLRNQTKERATRPQAPHPKPPDLTHKTCAQFFKLGVLGARILKTVNYVCHTMSSQFAIRCPQSYRTINYSDSRNASNASNLPRIFLRFASLAARWNEIYIYASKRLISFNFVIKKDHITTDHRYHLEQIQLCLRCGSRDNRKAAQ